MFIDKLYHIFFMLIISYNGEQRAGASFFHKNGSAVYIPGAGGHQFFAGKAQVLCGHVIYVAG